MFSFIKSYKKWIRFKRFKIALGELEEKPIKSTFSIRNTALFFWVSRKSQIASKKEIISILYFWEVNLDSNFLFPELKYWIMVILDGFLSCNIASRISICLSALYPLDFLFFYYSFIDIFILSYMVVVILCKFYQI